MPFDDDYCFWLDPAVAPRRFVLIDEASGEIGYDLDMTQHDAEEINTELRHQGSRWRLFPWAQMSEAA